MKGKKSKSCTGNGDKGIAAYMSGKKDSKQAFVKLGNTKFATGTKYSKKK